MTFQTITLAEIAEGEPITTTLLSKVKNSLDDLNLRLISSDVDAVSSNNTMTATSSFLVQAGDTSGGAFTTTLPAASSMTNRSLGFIKTSSDAYAWTIDGAASDTINGAATQTIEDQWQALILISTGTEWFVRSSYHYDDVVFTTRSINTTAPITGGGNLSSDRTLALNPLVNADFSASAAIAYSKLNLATSIVNADISGSAAIAYSKLNLATSIVNADINSSAAIAYSKFPALTASKSVVTNGSGVLTTQTAPTLTELGYLSGVTSAIQTQFTNTIPKFYKPGPFYTDFTVEIDHPTYPASWTSVSSNTHVNIFVSGDPYTTMGGILIICATEIVNIPPLIATNDQYLYLYSRTAAGTYSLDLISEVGTAQGYEFRLQTSVGQLQVQNLTAEPGSYAGTRFTVRALSVKDNM